MIKKISIWFLMFSAFTVFSQDTHDSEMISKIFKEELMNGEAYKNLGEMCGTIGSRLSGSEGAAKAVLFMKKLMEDYHFDSVWLQPVMVPHWVRGAKEVSYFTVNNKEKTVLRITALGGSISTAPEGIEAEVIEVDSLSALKKLGKEKVQGKIVFFNRPFDESKVTTFDAYGGAGDQRWAGPSEAAKYGAIGSITRSMGNGITIYPHTGAMSYKDSINKIPCAAIATADAELLSAQLKKNSSLKLYMKLNSKMLDSVLSYNVVGELKGTEHAEEIIITGGHLDSWDLGTGAHDDGAGCVQSVDVLRIFKALKMKPKRTIRCVLFMNEENGLRGGKKYAELAKQNKEKHIAALETDAGGFTPRGFGITSDSIKTKKFITYAKYFKKYHITEFEEHGGGADIGPLREQQVPLIGYEPDSQRYFDHHHTALDTFEYVHRRELHMGAAAIAALLYLISENGW